ncbi:hypothetical protein JCM11641_005571 [Rhodosporidiobolus odoratus]
MQAELTALIPPLQAFFDRSRQQDVMLRAGWACWAFSAVLLISTFLVIAVPYFRFLSREFGVVDSAIGSEPALGGSFSMPRQGHIKDPRKEVRKAYWDMVFATFAIILGAVVYGGSAFALAILGNEKSNSPIGLQVSSLASLYASALVAAPTAALALLRALQLSASPRGTMLDLDSLIFLDAGERPAQNVPVKSSDLRTRPLPSLVGTAFPTSPLRFSVQRTLEIVRTVSESVGKEMGERGGMQRA